MTNRLLLAMASLLALAGLAWLGRPYQEPSERAPADRSPLALLTSLPLTFGETFGLEGGGSPALTSLEQRYKVVPISVADAASLKGHGLLLMAHPRAQPAEALVELDQWVRDGGRLVLLADPKLDWPNNRPLGDVLRPPPIFADTGLLNHWGLRLTAPEGSTPDRGGGGTDAVTYFSAGRIASSNDQCQLSRGGIVAECKIGRGQVAVVADADFLNVDGLASYGVSADQQLGDLVELLDAGGTR